MGIHIKKILMKFYSFVFFLCCCSLPLFPKGYRP